MDVLKGKFDDNHEDEDNIPGYSEIFEIPVDSIKIGGLRLFLSLFFMGQLNFPEKKSWKSCQNGDGGIELFFNDQTGALIVDFTEDAIQVQRLGSTPSMKYLENESIMLNGMLDQLDEISTDSSIKESDRLFQLSDPSATIQTVRESLAFN